MFIMNKNGGRIPLWCIVLLLLFFSPKEEEKRSFSDFPRESSSNVRTAGLRRNMVCFLLLVCYGLADQDSFANIELANVAQLHVDPSVSQAGWVRRLLRHVRGELSSEERRRKIRLLRGNHLCSTSFDPCCCPFSLCKVSSLIKHRSHVNGVTNNN